MKRTAFYIILSFVLLTSLTEGQTVKTNLDVYFELLSRQQDSLAQKRIKLVTEPAKPEFAVLSDFVNNLKSKEGLRDTAYAVIDSAVTEYPEIFRDGFFGDYFVKRTIILTMKFEKEKERIAATDTVNVNLRHEIENPALPFTRGKLPAEPFLESLVEPVVFIVTATAIAFGLFYARTK